MNKNFLTSCTIFALFTIVTLSGFFLLNIEQIAINIWSLVFLIFSYIVTLSSTLFLLTKRANSDDVFAFTGINSLLFVYQISVFVSVALVWLTNIHLGTFIFIQLVLNAIFIIMFVLLMFSSKSINETNLKTMQKLENGDFNNEKRGGF